ncbi:MAG: hypothetical protein LBQ40_00810 [Clostridiales bacterium]|jgi:hypothetical protein|nr:hypothetical protein [Clostridiales bacterium]
MAKEFMVFCDFCALGFEIKKSVLQKRDKETDKRKQDGTYDENDEAFMTACVKCRDMLGRLDKNSGKAAEYFARLLMSGVTLKNAYRILISRAGFRLGLASYAARLRVKPLQRQDGLTGVRLSFKDGAAGGGSVMPPIVFGIDAEGVKDGGFSGVAFDKPYYAGQVSDKRDSNA